VSHQNGRRGEGGQQAGKIGQERSPGPAIDAGQRLVQQGDWTAER